VILRPSYFYLQGGAGPKPGSSALFLRRHPTGTRPTAGSYEVRSRRISV
jgi:hypothetical protein